MVKMLALGVVALVLAACAVTVDPNYRLTAGTGAAGGTTTGGAGAAGGTTTGCGTVDAVCSNDTDCCSGSYCDQGTGVCGAAPTCAQNGGPCKADADCCNGLLCDSGTGVCGAGAACGAVGFTGCTADTDCCQSPGMEACAAQAGVANTCLLCCTESAQCGAAGCCFPGTEMGVGSACTGACIEGSSPECLP